MTRILKRLAIVAALAAAIASPLLLRRPTTTPTAAGRRGGGLDRPAPVAVATAELGDIDVVIGALGTITARQTVTVQPRVDGQLLRLHMHEGELVRAGALLAEIDPRPFQNQLDEAKGTLARDEAQLANARRDLQRYRDLLQQQLIAPQTVDAQQTLVEQYEGAVRADKAAVASAQLQLTYSRVTAPISGRLGLRQVDAGNVIRAADPKGLVVITQTDPIDALFSIPADDLPAVVARRAAGDTLQVEAYGRDNDKLLASGTLLTIDNQIDTSTGTVKLKGSFANADGRLFPNQFVNIRLRVETKRGAVLLPLAAVQRGKDGPFCFVVNDDKTVTLQTIALGPTAGDKVAITSGIAAGAIVVIDGADKLGRGSKVEVITPGGA